MHYIVQENTFNEPNYDNLIKVLSKFELPYTICRSYPFIDKITEAVEGKGPDELPELEVNTNNVFVFGSVKLARLAANKGWNPGSLVSDKHDFLDYGPKYGINMLNHDSTIITFFDLMFKTWEGKIFLRPTHDGKLFDAGLFTVDEWRSKAENIKTNKPDLLAVYEKIQMAKPKLVQKEIRFWIVNGEPVTASQYRLNMKYCVDSFVDDQAWDFVRKMCKIHCIADSFVMDVCLHNDEWKIVECGCINSAGFYLADMQKLITKIHDRYNYESVL